jgi:phosphate transport system substrate-binding protein
MYPQADGVITSVNTWVNTNEAATLLLVAAISAACGLLWQRMTRRRRRLGWSVLYDEPINQGDPLTPLGHAPQGETAAGNGESPAAPQNMWEIIYQDSDPATPPYKVTNGSLVVVEMRNIGSVPVRESDFDKRGDFNIRFPGRKVVHYKVRDNDRYHQKVYADERAVVRPGVADSFALPSLQVNHNEGFKLLVLLESPTKEPPIRYEKPVIEGSIAGGGFVEHAGPARRRMRVFLAAGAVILLAVGAVVGIKIANQALAPNPACAPGKLDIEGSTAFAPIFNEVVTEYEQRCSQAQITIRAVGSVQGLQDLERNTSSTPIVAMYDGTPEPEPTAPVTGQAVGVIIFSVVGNRSLGAPKFAAGSGGGMSAQAIAQAYEHPFGSGFVPVGRSSVSGTRATFAQEVLGGDDSVESTARPCPAIGSPPPNGVCLEDTTMDLLTYVNDTPNAIGYAESDALPFFPNVGTIPIGGYEPNRQNVLDGKYTFYATEHLDTKGNPGALAHDLISFLKSQYETTQLRDTQFIACADLGGSQIANACDN